VCVSGFFLLQQGRCTSRCGTDVAKKREAERGGHSAFAKHAAIPRCGMDATLCGTDAAVAIAAKGKCGAAGL